MMPPESPAIAVKSPVKPAPVKPAPIAAKTAESEALPLSSPSPTQTQASAPSPATAIDVLVLYRKNMEAMRTYYRLQPDAGRELGHLVLLELSITDTLRALDLAFEGKDWIPTPKK